MKIYNTEDWLKAIISFPKTDVFHKLYPFLILLAIYSAAIAYFELEYLKLNEKSWLKEITTVHSLLGFVLSLLLVFRTNTGYDRWWEGRKQWGTLTNISRSMAIKLNGMLSKYDLENRAFFRKNIPLYSKSLFSFLRSDYSTFMLDTQKNLDLTFYAEHVPNQVAKRMYERLMELYREGKLTTDEIMIMDKEFAAFTDVCGACERIKNTPIPFSYSSFIKKFIVLYVVSLPIGLVFSMGYFVTIAVPFIFYALASLELIAESIEQPFGFGPDDLPIEEITINIERNVNEIL